MKTLNYAKAVTVAMGWLMIGNLAGMTTCQDQIDDAFARLDALHSELFGGE